MADRDAVLERITEQLRRTSPDWTVTREDQGDGQIVIRMSHPYELGMCMHIDRSDDVLVERVTRSVNQALSSSGPIAWPSLVRELMLASKVPAEVPHAELVESLQMLIISHGWTEGVVRNLAGTLHHHGCITADEAQWLRAMAMPDE